MKDIYLSTMNVFYKTAKKGMQKKTFPFSVFFANNFADIKICTIFALSLNETATRTKGFFTI